MLRYLTRAGILAVTLVIALGGQSLRAVFPAGEDAHLVDAIGLPGDMPAGRLPVQQQMQSDEGAQNPLASSEKRGGHLIVNFAVGSFVHVRPATLQSLREAARHGEAQGLLPHAAISLATVRLLI